MNLEERLECNNKFDIGMDFESGNDYSIIKNYKYAIGCLFSVPLIFTIGFPVATVYAFNHLFQESKKLYYDAFGIDYEKVGDIFSSDPFFPYYRAKQI